MTIGRSIIIIIIINKGNQSYVHLEEDLDCRSHGGLDVDLSNILPLLLEKRRQKVGSQLGVDNDLLLVHLDIPDGDIEAHDLSHLELDSGLDLVDLFLHIITSGQERWEFTRLGEAGSEKTGDLFDHVVGGEEKVVTLGKFLDELLVLVELFEVLHGHVVDSDPIGLFAVGGVSEHAAFEVGAGHGGELEGSGETLVAGGVVVFEGELRLDGLDEVAFLSFDFFSHAGDGFAGGEGEDVNDGLVEESGV
mmetsp:Transcript_15298/g.22143  ORF Transcript_15298/g.22143 Transcript_15298/m.22143 type:complete len:249 (+) Transcript_15298:529-1275(+)